MVNPRRVCSALIRATGLQQVPRSVAPVCEGVGGEEMNGVLKALRDRCRAGLRIGGLRMT